MADRIYTTPSQVQEIVQEALNLTSEALQDITVAGYTAESPYLASPASIDINNSTDTITQTTDDAVITTTFSSSNGVDTITSNIVMTSGDYDYVRVTTITPNGNIDEIRTTLTKVAKSA